MTIELRVNGARYGGWKSAKVTRGIEAVAGNFELSVSDRWAETGQAWPIGEEDECTLLVGNIPLITGYVDRRSLSYGATEHTLSVAGRDKTGSLVDCSALLGKWEFAGVSILTFAKRLCEPFGISVALQAGLVLGPSPAKLSINPGDTAFNVLEHACRLAGVLPVSDGAGGLLLTRAGASRATTALVEGGNILSASATYDATGRFARYVCMGQHRGNDELEGESAASVRGNATDPNVRRTSRVLVVRPEGNVTPLQARRRAEWEATVRAARGDAVTVTVQGWTQGSGVLWPVNALVRVESPLIGVRGDMLITQATYGLDASAGTTTELTLKRPDAFTPEPSVPLAAGRWKEIAGGV